MAWLRAGVGFLEDAPLVLGGKLTALGFCFDLRIHLDGMLSRASMMMTSLETLKTSLALGIKLFEESVSMDIGTEGLLDVIRSGEFGSYVGRLPIAKQAIRRLQMDDDLAKLLTSHLTGNPSASNKATIPRLLAAARGVPPELRQWCIQESAAQLKEGASPETGFDLVSLEVRPVVHSLFDVLATGQ